MNRGRYPINPCAFQTLSTYMPSRSTVRIPGRMPGASDFLNTSEFPTELPSHKHVLLEGVQVDQQLSHIK